MHDWTRYLESVGSSDIVAHARTTKGARRRVTLHAVDDGQRTRFDQPFQSMVAAHVMEKQGKIS